MTFQEWIREERKTKKHVSNESTWNACMRHGVEKFNNKRMLFFLDRLKNYIDSDFDGKICKGSWIDSEVGFLLKQLKE